MGWNSRGFEIGNTLDRRAYPAARRNRTGPPPVGAAGPFAQPIGSNIGRTRVFPFRINELAAGRNTISTPKLLGNVVIHSLYFQYGTTGDPPPSTIEIGYALTPISEIGVALTVPRPYTVLTELIDQSNQIANDRGQGFPSTTSNSPQRGTRIPLGLIVMERELAVVIADVNPSIFVQGIFGYFNLTENLSDAALAGYIPAA